MTAGDLSVRPEAAPFLGGHRLMRWTLGLAALGTAVWLVGLWLDPRQAIFSYLIAFAYALSLVLGSMAFVLAVNAAGATWPVAIRRMPEAVMATLPLFALLFLPVALGADLLYPWMHIDAVESAEARHLLEHRRSYLNLPFVLGRAGFFLVLWIAIGGWLRRLSGRMDRPHPPAGWPDRQRRISSVALPAFGITATMAAWDWLMSLSAEWFSTMFGLYFLSGGFLGALALTTVLVLSIQRAGFLPEVGPSHYYALGRLMFAFLIFWAYTGYWQFFITWIANRPLEVGWFVRRATGGYGVVALFLIFGHFALPFLVMLSFWIKRRAWGVAVIALWLLLSRYFDVHWVVAPARETGAPFSWMDPAALLSVVGWALAFGLWRQRGRLVAPLYDPLFLRALEYRSP